MYMLIVSIKMIIDAIMKLIHGNEIIFSWWLIIVCIVTIIVKVSLFIYTKMAYKKYNNILIQSSMEIGRAHV